MTQGEYQPVRVSRRIAAPAEEIFRILADPARHLDLDGSGMLRGAATSAVISGVGDVFVMKMFHAPFGDYQMDNHVVEYEPNRRIGWEPAAGKGHPAASDDDRDNHDDGDGRWGHRWSYELTPDGPGATIVTEIYDCSRAPEEARMDMRNGAVWAESMAKTLERLDEMCTGRQEQRPDNASVEVRGG